MFDTYKVCIFLSIITLICIEGCFELDIYNAEWYIKYIYLPILAICYIHLLIILICDYRFERYLKYEEPVEAILYERERNARLALLDNLRRQTTRFYQPLYISIPITNISGN